MRIGVGIPVFKDYPSEVAHDYMRMWYSFGRRMTEHDFFLIAKAKSEQFRARNAIVETALQFSCDYLLFLDDDHIFDWQQTPNHHAYGFLERLLAHMRNNEKMGVCGALYYHRTGRYKPVLMKHTGVPGATYQFLDDTEITGGLQRVDVQGGGVMLINMKIFDKILPPYFEPEMQTDGNKLGTDIQLCRKAAEAGYEVWSDTSIVVGHLQQERQVVHAENRDSFVADNAMRVGIAEDWVLDHWMTEYRDDAREYSGLTNDEIVEKAIQYHGGDVRFTDYDDPKDYYRQLGVEQLCRQVYYHSAPDVARQGLTILKRFKRGFRGYGLDFGCGSSPIGFEFLKQGHRIDFVDIEGAGAYEFTKWRIAKYDALSDAAGWSLAGPYDFILTMDVIEHLKDWEADLDNILGRLKPEGVLVTNYFSTHDYTNPEHINMNHAAVAEFLASRGMMPESNMFWVKQDNMFGALGAKAVSNEHSEKDGVLLAQGGAD